MTDTPATWVLMPHITELEEQLDQTREALAKALAEPCRFCGVKYVDPDDPPWPSVDNSGSLASESEDEHPDAYQWCDICGYDVGRTSHYHCGNCDEESGAYGHWINGSFDCPKDRKT
jgi:hypothetical protein